MTQRNMGLSSQLAIWIDALYVRFDEIQSERVMSIYTDEALGLKTLVQVAEALAQKYDVVVTNPPYMGASGMSAKLSDYVKELS